MKLFQIKQVYLVLAWNFNLFMVANRLNGFAESLRFLLGLFLVCLPEFCVREYGPIRNFGALLGAGLKNTYHLRVN